MKNQKGFTFIEVIQVVAIIAILFLFFFSGVCADSSLAIRAMEKQGYKNAQIVSEEKFFVWAKGCSGHDAAKFNMKATNVANEEVEVFVCVGWPFKGATLRTD